jgi:hypothetical protein
MRDGHGREVGRRNKIGRRSCGYAMWIRLGNLFVDGCGWKMKWDGSRARSGRSVALVVGWGGLVGLHVDGWGRLTRVSENSEGGGLRVDGWGV